MLRLLVSPGDELAKEQPMLEIETGKASVEVPAAVAGRVKALHVKTGDKIKSGQVILTLEMVEAGAEPLTPTAEGMAAAPLAPQNEETPMELQETPASSSAPPPSPAPPAARLPVLAAPSVRQFAREIGVDVEQVAGSGPSGRVSIEDVKAQSRRRTGTAILAKPAAGDAPLPDLSAFGEVTREPMNNLRALTAAQMALAWTTVPMVTQTDKADLTRLEELRKKHAPVVEAAGGKLTLTVILLKVLAAALRRFPNFNAAVDIAKRELVYRKYCHLGVAVDTDRGLLAPVIRDADRKNLVQLAVELVELAKRARERKVRPEELQGGCMTLTNLGGLGGSFFTPIVNPPETAILGVGRAAREAFWNGERFEPRLMLPLALTYDHRTIDGADGVRFLRFVAQALEEPFVLLLGQREAPA